jgi:hypothetical protein
MRYTTLLESSLRSQFAVGDSVKDKTDPNSPLYTITDTDDWDCARLETADGAEIEIRYGDLEKVTIEEGYRGDWAILPATMSLYGKRVVDLITAASTWSNHDTTILVCKKTEADGRERFAFVSSGHDDFDHYSAKIGKSYSTYHDQTGQDKGRYTIVNVVVLKNNQIVKHVNDVGLRVKASLAVFK